MIAIPDVREIPLDGGEDFLILACDGLWDFLSEDDAARMVYNMVRENPGKSTCRSKLSRKREGSDAKNKTSTCCFKTKHITPF